MTYKDHFNESHNYIENIAPSEKQLLKIIKVDTLEKQNQLLKILTNTTQMNEASPMHQLVENLWEVNKPLVNENPKDIVAT